MSALRADYATPLARRDAVLAELQASGESREPWTQQARTALDTKSMLASGVALLLTGCGSTVGGWGGAVNFLPEETGELVYLGPVSPNPRIFNGTTEVPLECAKDPNF